MQADDTPGPERRENGLAGDGRMKSLARTAWEWCKSVLVAFTLFLVIRAFLVEAFKIPTASMEDTLLVGDFLVVNKAVYGAEIPGTSLHLPAFSEPKRGDVIVFTPPHDPGKNYVKRVVGVPGEVIEMRAKKLYVNDLLIDERMPDLDLRRDEFHPDMAWQANYLATWISGGMNSIPTVRCVAGPGSSTTPSILGSGDRYRGCGTCAGAESAGLWLAGRGRSGLPARRLYERREASERGLQEAA